MPRNGKNNTHDVYKEKPKKLGSKGTRKPSPYLTNSQSMKSIIDKVWSSIYALAQFTKLYKKEYLIAWLARSTLFLP